MHRHLVLIPVLLIASCTHIATQKAEVPKESPLLHWSFDEGAGTTTKDLFGNGLDGAVTASWVDSPSGKALMMDGTSKGIVSVQLPEEQRFGKKSWTFMAMLRPTQFHIDNQQNQRRIFAFGLFPQAYLVIDLSGKGGTLMSYFCYKNEDNKTISAGSSSNVPLTKGMWAHVAIVCNRETHQTEMYVNGYSSGPSVLPKAFDGDYVQGGLLTVGNEWHNYWGLLDEVKIARSALSKQAVEAEFSRLKDIFEIVESEESIAAKKRDRLARMFPKVNEAWASGKFDDVRSMCQEMIAAADALPNFRSYAHLRMAQSYLSEGNRQAAKSTYEAIAADASYPPVHRWEARESIKELERIQQGLPARDPAASRTAVPTIATFAGEVFVAPNGNDANDGSARLPFATLARARDEVRAMKARGVVGAIAVTVMPGEFKVTETLALSQEDSGTVDAPVVYRAKEKGKSIFYGGRRLSGFERVTDASILQRVPAKARGKIWQCDLRSLGIDDYGKLAVRGFGQPTPPPTLEVYFNRVPMTLARWPNKGFVGIRKLVNGGSKPKNEPSVFEYDSDRHERWLQATDGWIFGYFHFLWADATAKIGTIDPQAHTLTTAQPYHYGGRGMSTRQGIQYYAFNLLEEIDMPGEWYLERDTGMLYLFPPSNPRKATIEVGTMSTPMVTMDKVANLRVEGLVFDLSRTNGIVVTNSDDCLIAACVVSRMAGNGIMVHGGVRNTLLGCDVHTIGRRATEVKGGDRETLTPGGHLVENCHIYDFGRIDRTYTPGIQLEGVGHRVAHNLMHHCPSSVMRIEGNDHLMEFNEVHSAVQESDDQGAMELFANATYRGVVFRHNYFHHVGKTGSEAAVHGQAAIRFDDAISGMLVYGNVFQRSANGHFGAIQMNSGRDNVMDNNLFVDCKQGISGGWNAGNSVWRRLRDGVKMNNFYMNDLYLARYPKIATMLEAPGINHVWRNVFYRCGTPATRRNGLDLLGNGVFEDTDPGFRKARKGDFRLRKNARLFDTVGFKPIPFKEIGLYDSPYRATWPVKTTPAEVPEWRTSE